jgi:hypothetical protein
MDSIIVLSNVNYLRDDKDSMYMRIHVLNCLSKHKKSIGLFAESSIVDLINFVLEGNQEWGENVVPYICQLISNICRNPQILKQILDEDIINDIYHLWLKNKSVDLEDVIKLVAHISSLPLFKSDQIDEEIYTQIFDFFFTNIQEVNKQNLQKVNSSLICILNMSKSDMSLIKAINNSNFMKIAKDIIVEESVWEPSSPFFDTLNIFILILANLILDKKFLSQNLSQFLDFLNIFHQKVESFQCQNLNVNVGFLKILHNLIIVNLGCIQQRVI